MYPYYIVQRIEASIMPGTIQKLREILTRREKMQVGILLIMVHMLERGKIAVGGTYDQLMESNLDFQKMAKVKV